VAARPSATEPVSAIEYYRPSRAPLFPLLLLSIGLHLVLAWGVVFVLSRHLKAPEKIDELSIDVMLGEPVQELIVAAANPDAPAPSADRTPPLPSAPMPADPVPEPPPVSLQKSEFAEPKREPTPTPKAAPKRPASKAPPPKLAGAPAGAKVGPVPQDGVVGGNVNSGATTGSPGGPKAGMTGWSRPNNIGYPPAALFSRIEGRVVVELKTNATGKIVSVVILESSNPIFDAFTRQSVPAHWHGPPNATGRHTVIYKIR
jgi:TonB family protein